MSATPRVSHVLVVYDGSKAMGSAIAEAGQIADRSHAKLTVVVLVAHEDKAVGCCFPANAWNRELDAICAQEAEAARAILQDLGSDAAVVVAEGRGAAGLASAARSLSCDAIVVPGHGARARRLRAALRRRGGVLVIDAARAA